MVAVVVLAAAVAGTITPIVAAQDQAVVLRQRATALSLGRELIEEIASRPYSPPSGSTQAGWTGGQHDRSQYDCIGDYAGYTDSTEAMVTDAGRALAFDTSDGVYVRKVTVQDGANPSCSTGASSDFALVTVTVTTPMGESVPVTRLVCNKTVTW